MFPAQRSEGGSGVFEETGSLATARVQHTATLLPDGEVLVAGGVSFSHYLASAERYDPASGQWKATGSLAAARGAHTATLLPNGRVLVIGGYDNAVGYVDRAELYLPASEVWTTIGSPATARFFHTATLLPNGKVLVAGGGVNTFPFVSGTAELYDPASGTWVTTGSLGVARYQHTATLLPNGKVLVAGGSSSEDLASAELYDPETGTWTTTGNLATARAFHTATLLPNGKVLVAGGGNNSDILASAELYDPASETWTPTGSLSTARVAHTATLLPGGQVLVAGGLHVASAELYDPASETWTATGSLSTARNEYSATLLPNGKVLAVGGDDENDVTVASAELFNGQPSPPALLNISTRIQVLNGTKVLIAGFIVTGTDLKRVLIRGIGPSLNSGVALSDPTLELHEGTQMIATNDNWKMRPEGNSQQADIEATTIPPSSDLESAILVALSPGTYTAILAGKDGGTGVGLVEVYDLGQGANSELANISARGFVDAGDNVMIGGLIVGGGPAGATAQVMVRALGPSVSVTGALSDPTLEVRDGSGTLVASNDNWKTRPDGGSQQAEIEATGIAPPNDLESALVQILPAGNYTAIVRGMNGTSGVGLVEVYHLP